MNLKFKDVPKIEHVPIPYYKKVIGKSRLAWYIPATDYPAENLHVEPNPEQNKPGYRGFRGYAGSTLNFRLKDGSIDAVTGPWHSSANNLYMDTGINLKGLIRTWTCIYLYRGKYGTFNDVVYYDPSVQIGFNLNGFIQTICYIISQPVFVYIATYSGSSDRMIDIWNSTY